MCRQWFVTFLAQALLPTALAVGTTVRAPANRAAPNAATVPTLRNLVLLTCSPSWFAPDAS